MADGVTDTSTALDGISGDAGQFTGTESSLSNWAGDYVTDMLGRGWAMADEGYQNFEGPLTAGQTDLQTQAFQGLAGLTIPTDNMSFAPGSFTDPGVAGQFMNPYTEQALQPTMDEIQRQAQMQAQRDNAQLTQAGAYGGSRQALMNAENNRNMLDQMARTYAEGMNTAYGQAANQFNTEQNLGLQAAQNAQNFGLGALGQQAQLGELQRGIQDAGYQADLAQFQEERDFPYKQVQYMQSLLQGLPLAAQSYSYSSPSTLSTALSSAGGIRDLYNTFFGDSGGSSTTNYSDASTYAGVDSGLNANALTNDATSGGAG